MIQFIRLLRSISTFDYVDTGAGLPLDAFSLIYAENGRGKTTLAAILRSLAKDDSIPILERTRLGANQPPHIVIASTDGDTAVFQNGAWNDRFGDFAIFDDTFVAENICSGLEIDSAHRKKLHELVIGAQGVALSNTLQGYVDRVERHNRDLYARSSAIPAAVRAGLTVDQFCALEPHENIDAEVQAAEQALAAARQQAEISQKAAFTPLTLPDFAVDEISALLGEDLPNLEAAAAARVQEHFQKLGVQGENWVADGMGRIDSVSAGLPEPYCPFCAQPLSGSALIAHYQAYFSEEYARLQLSVYNQLEQFRQTHSGEVQAAFERAVRVAGELRQFWSGFTDVPEIELDTEDIVRSSLAASRAVIAALERKQAAPLEQIALPDDCTALVEAYRAHRAQVAAESEALTGVNAQIAIVKESAASANVAALQTDLTRVRSIRARFTPEFAALCNDYLQERATKTETEGLRHAARTALDEYRGGVFAAYQETINDYLRRFNAGFRLIGVNSVNTRAGSSCNYSVLINDVEVPLSARDETSPSFKNTLSAGDRNALALAFFFTSLENDPNRANKIVVIDDPITSLDDHRSLTTIQEMRRLAADVRQLIVLSHSKPFLCGLWEGADTDTRAALRIIRANPGSTLAEWDVSEDSITEHDRRHALVRQYIDDPTGVEERAVAAALRPILEVFARVAYPRWYPPGSLLGPFIGLCEQREGTPEEIISSADRVELRALLDYGNLFHHDTNPAWQTVFINDHELLNFAQRTLRFAQR